MTADDLQDLYNELRGSRSSFPITDARGMFMDRQMQAALAKVQESYELYRESRYRILRQDPAKQVDAKAPDREAQIRRLTRKQNKAKEILAKFEELLPELTKLADKEKAKQAAAVVVKDEAAAAQRSPFAVESDFDRVFLDGFQESDGDDQLDLVSSQFAFKPLAIESDIQFGAIYLLRDDGKSLLIRADKSTSGDRSITGVDIHRPENAIQLTHSSMIQLSQDRKLVVLLPQP